MSKTNLNQRASALPDAWRSSVIGRAAGANIKVLRMDEQAYLNEVRPFDEALLVLEGQMNLLLAGEVVTVGVGEVYIVPAGVPHAVAPGSFGTLIIIDQ